MAPVLGLSVIHNRPFDQRLHYNETDEVHCGRGRGQPSGTASRGRSMSEFLQSLKPPLGPAHRWWIETRHRETISGLHP